MINFWLPSPIAVPVTTARQSQHGNVMTSHGSFSSGNRIYFLAPMRYGSYLHQWHSGGAVSVTPHRPVSENTAPESRESDTDTTQETGERETATETLRHTQGVAAQNRILTQNQSDRVQARSVIEPDASIAADFEMSETEIQRRRNARRLAAFKPSKLRKKYTMLTQNQLDSIQARLGIETDASIAADFGVSRSTIQSRRREQGIAAMKPHGSHKYYRKLTQSQLDSFQARLGCETDVDIAADLGVSKTTIRKHRIAQGISASRPRKTYIRLTQSQSKHIQARLGKEPDASIAADFGMCENTIQSRRSAQGIPAFQPHKPCIKLTKSQIELVQARLGSEPDVSIAADFGVSRSLIQKRRHAQGIASYKPKKLS